MFITMKFKHETTLGLVYSRGPPILTIHDQFSNDQQLGQATAAGAGDKKSEIERMHRVSANAIIKLTDQIKAFIIYTFLIRTFSMK